MLVVVGSTSPVKVEAAHGAFEPFFEGVEVKGLDVPSGVGSFPLSDEETLMGALNRVRLSSEAEPGVDLEWYVPQEQRKSKGASMLANPNMNGQMLLGGVFSKFHPLKERTQDIKYDHFWLWKEKDEKALVNNMYIYIKDEWKNFEGTDWRQADLILCGQGTSRFDIPILYIKSVDYNVDSKDEIFYTLFKTKQIDLSNVVIPLIGADLMYPSNWNLICKRFGFNRLKESGASVWDMYDTQQYDQIEKRTEQEVKDCINLYDFIIKRFMTKIKREK